MGRKVASVAISLVLLVIISGTAATALATVDHMIFNTANYTDVWYTWFFIVILGDLVYTWIANSTSLLDEVDSNTK